MPAKSSIDGFRIFLNRGLALSAIYIEVARPRGNARSMAPRLTHKVPRMIGRIPKLATGCVVGYQAFPNRNSETLIFCTSTICPLKSLSIYDLGRNAMIL